LIEGAPLSGEDEKIVERIRSSSSLSS